MTATSTVGVPTLSAAREVLEGLQWPDEWLMGTASAGYQCEGGYNVGNGPRNNWAEWEARQGNERTGPCARFWDFPERDFSLARRIGANAYRLSIEWARVQPVRERRVLSSPPAWDNAALERYVDLLSMARKHGVEPVVTLHHFTHPYWTGLDLWLNDEGVDRFVAYVEVAVPAVNERLLARGEAPIRTWITINEPNVLAVGTYLSSAMPSGHGLDLGSPGRLVRALDGLYAGHVRAYGSIHRWYEARGLAKPRVSFNNFVFDFYGVDRFFVDFVLGRSRGIAFGAPLKRDLEQREKAFNTALAPVITRSRKVAPERWLAAHGLRALGPRLFMADRFQRLRRAIEASDWERPLDFVAIDYYDPTLANQVKMAAGGYDPWDWEAIPEGLYELLRVNGSDGLPVLIAENGMATRRVVGGRSEARADGVMRDEFLKAHLFQVLRAIKDGVPVFGYLHWSLTDNYEWGRFAPRFGLFGVDYSDEDRRRLPVDAAKVDSASAFEAIARAMQSRDADALARALSS